ncbi:MAG: RHS repeat-associated core domain-containing protein [Anaerolineae bacterium]|nr:RHS repeat-associated core domain-containing protein [Anaerolineae bacterium]
MRVGTSTWYFLLTDHLGSTARTATSSGTLYGELRYRAWGENRYSWGTTPTTYHFTGQREESTIGLYFYNARWYDPALGRFAQADTIVPGPGNPQALNRYAYVYNNPMKYTDPSGHYIFEEDPDDPVLHSKYIRSKMCRPTRSVIQSQPTHHIRKGRPCASHSAHSLGNVCDSRVNLCSACCATGQLCSSRSAATLQKATVASEVIAEPMGVRFCGSLHARRCTTEPKG